MMTMPSVLCRARAHPLWIVAVSPVVEVSILTKRSAGRFRWVEAAQRGAQLIYQVGSQIWICRYHDGMGWPVHTG